MVLILILFYLFSPSLDSLALSFSTTFIFEFDASGSSYVSLTET